MTESLQHAFEAASQLPPEEQDAIATWLLEELQSERQWATSLAQSQDGLAKLAAEALEEHRDGKTQVLDPDEI